MVWKSEAFEKFKKFRYEVENKFKNLLRIFDWIEEVNILVKILELSHVNDSLTLDSSRY